MASKKQYKGCNNPNFFYNYSGNRNRGRVKSIDGDKVVISVNAGNKTGGLMDVTLSDFNFVPKVDDRINLCSTREGRMVIIKLDKTRQDYRKKFL